MDFSSQCSATNKTLDRDNREMNMKCRRSNERKKETRKGMKSEPEERFDINYIIFVSLREFLSWGENLVFVVCWELADRYRLVPAARAA
jgi:hypothetical protein